MHKDIHQNFGIGPQTHYFDRTNLYQTGWWSTELLTHSVCLVPALPRAEEEEEDHHGYQDTELGGVEEHKSVILHLLSQLKLGMDLTKVPRPFCL